MTELVETIEGLPNISGSEALIEQVMRDSQAQPVFLPDSSVEFSKIQSAAAVALHMHQPLIPAGGDGLQSAAVISNLQYMFDHPTLGDNHHAPVFHWCYKRMNQFISQLVDEGRQPRIMLDYSGALLYGLRQMGLGDVFDNLKRLTLEPRFQPAVEWLGTTWGHALAPSTPIQDFRLHVRAWQHHFAAIFGLAALSRVRGFSVAELALPNHPNVAYEFVKTLQACGYHWVLVQEDTVEDPETGQKSQRPHVPHLLRCTNTQGKTASIVAMIKTQGSDPRVVAQMQGYYVAKALSREAVGQQSIPPLVVQIADGENSLEMMNEFPRRYFEAVREASGSTIPLLNVTEYLEHLAAAGLSPEDFPVVQPAGQKQIWAEFEPGDRPDKLPRLIQRLRKIDNRFQMEDGRWTDKSAWVKKQGDHLDALDQTSALFYETMLKRRVATTDPRYRQALFHLLAAQSSAFYHLRDGDWVNFRNEFLRRANETLTTALKPRQAGQKAPQPAPEPFEAILPSPAAPELQPEAPAAGPAAETAAPEAKPEVAKPTPLEAKEAEASPAAPQPVLAKPAPPEAEPEILATRPDSRQLPRSAPETGQTEPKISVEASPVEPEVAKSEISPVGPVQDKTPEPAPSPQRKESSSLSKKKKPLG